MTDTTKSATPWHLWVVGVIAVLWNAYGGYDYIMSVTEGATYMAAAGMTPEQIAYYDAMPVWMMSVWAIGVWGGVAGSILLLLRSKLAFPVFVVSLAAFLFSLFCSYVLNDGGKIMGFLMVDGEKVASPLVFIMQGVVGIGCLFFVWYSRMAMKSGVLR